MQNQNPARPSAVHPRSPLGAMFLSLLLLPGVGSMYAGQAGAGIAFLGAWILGLILVFTSGIPAVILLMLVIAVWAPVHAFRSACAWNRARGIES
jgi:TM2 domain-containing membrane protein YozV